MIVLYLAGAVVGWVVLLALMGCTANGHRWAYHIDACERCAVTGTHIVHWEWMRRRR